MGTKSYHAKDGKFTSFDRANVVHQNGERFKVVRTLEPVKAQGDGDKTNDAPAAAENVAQVKSKVNAMAGRIAPQWIALSQIVESELDLITLVKKDPRFKAHKGKNPFVTSKGFGGRELLGDPHYPKPFTIMFLAPKENGQMRYYDWDGRGLKQQGDSEHFSTEKEATRVLKSKVLPEIRRYHPGDDGFIVGWK